MVRADGGVVFACERACPHEQAISAAAASRMAACIARAIWRGSACRTAGFRRAGRAARCGSIRRARPTVRSGSTPHR
jgi:hypothetical protein